MRCACGWDLAQDRRKVVRGFVLGVAADSLGSLLLVYALLRDRELLLPAVALLAVGGVLVVLGAVGMAHMRRALPRGTGT